MLTVIKSTLLTLSFAALFVVLGIPAELLRESKWKLSFPEISRVLKHADHTTAWHAVNRARELLATDPEWAERYHAAERLLKGDK